MRATLNDVRVKRAYDPASPEDGVRILVDRLWPRGLRKEDLQITSWLRDLAPSNELRKWFHAHPEQWAEFRRKYLAELRSPQAAGGVAQLYEIVSRSPRATLLFASKQLERNNATVLKEVLEGSRKPPAATRPGKASTRQSRKVHG